MSQPELSLPCTEEMYKLEYQLVVALSDPDYLSFDEYVKQRKERQQRAIEELRSYFMPFLTGNDAHVQALRTSGNNLTKGQIELAKTRSD